MLETKPEEAVLAQLHDWAASQENIRAIILTSSRVDPDRTPDALSDYDVVVYVRDTAPLIADDSWLAEFGSIMVRWPLQPQATFDAAWITQLVLFDDGVRIDFQITAQSTVDRSDLDQGYRVIVDKDGLADDLAPPTYTQFHIERPTAAAYADRVNAFWWDIIYVAKALYRGELNYAKYMLDGTIRFEKLLPLMKWYIGTSEGWAINLGIYGRWIDQYLDEPTWAHYQRTFAGAALADNWRALNETLDLARRLGKHVALELNFDYPSETDAKVTAYIATIQRAVHP